MARNRGVRLIFCVLLGSFVTVSASEAIIGVAPGGSVVRRHAVVGTAVVVNEDQEQQQQQAAAAQQQPSAATGAVAVGTVVPTLPAGCTTVVVSGVNYYHCGATYYKVYFQGTELVYVSVPPPQGTASAPPPQGTPSDDEDDED